MIPRAGLTSFAIACLSLAGCAHGVVSELPTAATPVVRIQSLTITPVGGGTIIAGLSAPITSSGPFPSTGAVLGAFAQYADGSGKYVEANWTSSDRNVIAVDGASLSAIARGTATISASAEGKTASETFTVEPTMAGNWVGTFVVDSCQAGGGSIYEYICMPPDPGRTPGTMAVGATPPLTLQITKSGNDLAAVAQFVDMRGTLAGSDRGSNFLTFKGDLTGSGRTITLVYWDTRARTDLMEGTIGFEVRIAGVSSFANVTAHLGNVTRR
jgi:hypothetical protein